VTGAPLSNPPGQAPGFLRRNRWLVWLAGALVALVAALAIAASLALHRVEPFLRSEIVAALEEHFHARVELDSFHVSLVKGLEAEGRGLRVWAPQSAVSATPASAEPIIRLGEFRFHAPLHYRPNQTIHIRTVELSGLEIRLPPRAKFAGASEEGIPQLARSSGWLSFDVDEIECTGARLVLETDKPGKLPLEFDIARLTLTDITPDLAAKFSTELTIPRPRGTLVSTGSFGPWQTRDPGESPIGGSYKLEHADLAAFKGIAGILDSAGRYGGTLRDLAVDGETSTPDFRLTHFGNALPLNTKFHATVDGTNGDTWLNPVDATLGRSHFTATGAVVRVAPGANGARSPGGHDISLDVHVDHARIEDFLDLASRKSTPLLTGSLRMDTTLHIPPGPEPLHTRLKLEGEFHLDEARFTSAKIQDRIRELSLRGQGRPGEVKSTDPLTIQSSMQGRFTMADGAITLPDLDYNVPGAEIKLAGTYGVEGGTLNFQGTAKMQATVSQMVGGWLGALLKPADRLLKKDGVGTEVPIRVEGTRESPDFAIDFGRMKSTSPQRPGER
jgi:hypothetical protein